MITLDDILRVADLVRSKQIDNLPPNPLMTAKQRYQWKLKQALPEYYPTYTTIVNEKNLVSVHADGIIPLWMFAKEYPGETDAELLHRENTYRPVTTAGWSKAVSKSATIWNPANYTVSWPDEDQMKYFTSEYPIDGNIFNWFSGYEHAYRLKDPNAVKYIWADNLLDAASNELLETYAVIEPSENIVYRGKTFVFINKGIKEGLATYLVLDEINYYIVKQISLNPNRFEVTEIFDGGHGLEEVPFDVLGGALAGDYYRSFFYPALADLDNVLLDSSMLRIVKDRTGYPKEYVYEDPCDACENGLVFVEMNEATKEEVWKPCPKCHGKQVDRGLMRTQVIQSTRSGDDRSAIQPPGYVEQSYQAPVMLRNEIDKQEEMAWRSINIAIVERPEGKTATEVLVNHEDQHQFFKTIKDVAFPSAKKSVRLIGKLRWREKFEDPTIVDPVSFFLRTAQELSDEVGKAVETNLPVNVRAGIVNQYERQRFAMTGREKAINETLRFADDLYYNTDVEVARKLAMGTVEKWKDVLHSSGVQLIQEILLEDDNFLELDLIRRRERLWEVARARVPQETSNFENNVFGA